jgi:hypothetical protein
VIQGLANGKRYGSAIEGSARGTSALGLITDKQTNNINKTNHKHKPDTMTSDNKLKASAKARASTSRRRVRL